MAPLLIIASLVALVAVSRQVPTPGEVRASFDAAQKFYAAEDYEQAIDTYERINRIESALLYADAITAEVGTIQAPVRDIALYQTGNSYLKRAEDLQKRAVRENEKEAAAALAQEADENFLEAVGYFRRAEAETEVEDLKDLARNRLITCLYESGRLDETVEEGEVFVESYPNSPFLVNVFYNIGWAHYDTERYEASIAAFERLVSHFPTGYRADRALFQIGEAHFNRGQYLEAVPWYRDVVDRQDIGTMSQADVLRMRREKIAGLVDETALELAAKAQIKMGDCYARSGDPAQAAQAYRRVIMAFSQERSLASEAHIRLADMYIESGDPAAAERTYREAIDGSRDRIFQAAMQSLLAEHFYRSGDHDRAIAEYELYVDAYADVGRASGLSPDAAEYKVGRAYFEIAEGHRQASRRDAAFLAYDRALEVYEAIERDYPYSKLSIAATAFNAALCYQMKGMMGDEASTAEALARYQLMIDGAVDEDYVRSALFQVARIHYQGEAYGRAVPTYERILESYADDPQRPSALFELALCYRELGEPQRAVTAFHQVDETSGLYPRAMLEASQMLAEERDYAGALAALGSGLEASDTAQDRSRLQYLKGRTLMEMDEFERAIEVLALAGAGSEEEGVTQGAAYGRGVSLFKLERYDEAVAELTTLVADGNGEMAAAARRMIGLAYLELGREAEAIDTYNSMLQSAQDVHERAAHQLVLAELYYSLRDYDEVVATCRRILALDIPDVRGEQPYFAKEKAYFLLGDTHNLRNEQDALIATYREALGHYPRSYYSGDMTFALGEALFGREDLAGAAQAFTTYREDFPDHPNQSYGLYYLGYALFNLTEFERAAEVFAELAAAYADSELAPDALFRAGEARYNLGQFTTARESYERVLEAHGGTDTADDAMYNLAWTLLNLEQEEEALATFDQLSETYASSPLAANARFTIGDYLYNDQRYEEALAAYEDVVARYPDSDVAKKVPEILGDLREVVAYLQYADVESVFVEALAEEDPAKFRQAIAGFMKIAEKFPGTESEIGALSNMGVSYESLGEWKEAVGVYDRVLERFAGEDAEGYEAYRFAKMHKEWIEESRL